MRSGCLQDQGQSGPEAGEGAFRFLQAREVAAWPVCLAFSRCQVPNPFVT